jgi:hypothetical protein
MDKLEIKQGSFIQQTQYFNTGQLVRWKPIFFRTELIFNGFVRWTDMLGNLWYFRISNILVHSVFVLYVFHLLSRKPNLEKKNLFKQILSQFLLDQIQFYLSWASGKWVSAKTVHYSWQILYGDKKKKK